MERINHKVTLGLLEGSREKEVNQSYFNFLYGKTENERFRLLTLLEQGEVSPKDFVKVSKRENTKLFLLACFMVKMKDKAPRVRYYQSISHRMAMIKLVNTCS